MWLKERFPESRDIRIYECMDIVNYKYERIIWQIRDQFEESGLSCQLKFPAEYTLCNSIALHVNSDGETTSLSFLVEDHENYVYVIGWEYKNSAAKEDYAAGLSALLCTTCFERERSFSFRAGFDFCEISDRQYHKSLPRMDQQVSIDSCYKGVWHLFLKIFKW
jgi:hypothetical protein